MGKQEALSLALQSKLTRATAKITIRSHLPITGKFPTTRTWRGIASLRTNLTSDFSQGDTGLSDFKSKLQHLSAEQIEALYSEYISGEKIAQLLERYAIDLAPSSLIKAFPPVPCAELVCPYCEVSLYERRKSRTANSWNDNLAYCPNCAHRHYFPGRNRWQRACACQPCLAAREQARQAKAIEQRKRIKEHWSLGKHLPVPLHTLSITRQLQLLAVLEIRMDTQTDCILAAEKTIGDARVSPSKGMDSTILLALHEDQILLVDPDSPLEAFSDDPTPKAWQNKVRWVANVSLDDAQRAGLGILHRALHTALCAGPQPQWHDELVAAIKSLCNEEVCAYIATRCAEHGLPFEARHKAAEVAAQLLDKHPVRHIWSLVNTAVRGALSFVARAQVNKLHAANTIPGSLLSLSERAIREDWQFTVSSYDSHAPRSGFSQALFDVLLQQRDHGLSRKVSDYIAELPVHADDNGCRLFCAMCGSNLVHVKAGPRETIVNCKDCLARTLIST
ncbi:hypothetical protein [Pseudomonas sp. NBRC 111130]|uniref:hypothetical protein n=1 Tax=Pseudomonas sp. NBRC 111130 TaxID=1661045 RepID=UPI002108FFF6|nr:hypothetical protein [Pseudomonas sp. NBRC 111130]